MDQQTDKPSYQDAWTHLKMRNIYRIQFTILFNHSYSYVNKHLSILHYIKAQIREAPNFVYQ